MTARGRRLLNVVVLGVGVALILFVASRAGSSSNGSSTNGSGPARDVPLFVRTTCADVVVLGLRGSGQSTTASKGVGNEVLASVSAMATQLHRRSDATVRLEAVPFPANYAPTLARYISHIKQGKKLMATRLTELSARCKDTSFAFVGFSQGANVVHNFSADLTAAQARRVAVVAMIADPVKNPA
ncbi:cutinase family protein, partial [Aeromicrobium sp.]|uniref:cutinase family protein n=1 Tax=Aeromicrobium sp. TaxID=1871063 RepID=UPI0019BDEEC3